MGGNIYLPLGLSLKVIQVLTYNFLLFLARKPYPRLPFRMKSQRRKPSLMPYLPMVTGEPVTWGNCGRVVLCAECIQDRVVCEYQETLMLEQGPWALRPRGAALEPGRASAT